ncbi:MAG: FIST N-terminal domain-containing protein [Deltaproteobacteria bacterium]
MRVEQARWTEGKKWEPVPPGELGHSAQLVLLFGSTSLLKDKKNVDLVRETYPDSHIFGCSTAGEIFGTEVSDNSLVMTALNFKDSTFDGTCIRLSKTKDSFQAGECLGRSLKKEGLVHVLVLSEGVKVNGSELVRGISKHIPEGVSITGGLSGDGLNFKETVVVWDGKAESNTIAVLGLYGSGLKVGFGSLGGWDPFGPERLITKSNGNILYEVDNKSALELYKRYLGDHAEGLPSSALLFPLEVRSKDSEIGVVRTILGISETDDSMTFAGDVPEGTYARLMKANFDRLIGGASTAAQTSYESVGSVTPDLALLISCVGRKMVLKQRIDEEVEGVRNVLGENTVLSGFYSYGEISPLNSSCKCELHNQTMTITTLSER